MIPFTWFIEAEERIGPFIQTTPLVYDETIDLYIKCENQQVTGSFKARGAFNKVLSLEKWEQEAGLLAASAGNHGQGVALAGRHVGAPATIFASENAPQIKIEAMRALGATVNLVPGGYGEAEKAALALAASSNATWISPYNDGHVVAGQGTVALEVLRQADSLYHTHLEAATWIVPTSGGGLLAGIAAVVNHLSPHARIVGVQTDTSPFMHALFHYGSQEGVIELPTIADGLAGPVEEGAITIPMVRQYVDDILLVSEAETARAVAYAWTHYGERIEASAAVTLGAILYGKLTAGPFVAILSGSNIQDQVFEEIIARGL
ncbi:MAG: threonine/serine dehydratase [Anaerolineales bacterium]|nr:threonine/serine dehydratase [Anaerolineales bacterium]